MQGISCLCLRANGIIPEWGAKYVGVNERPSQPSNAADGNNPDSDDSDNSDNSDNQEEDGNFTDDQIYHDYEVDT